jgi:alpha-2-macroglobulin
MAMNTALSLLTLLALTGLSWSLIPPGQLDYEKLRTQAEAKYAEGSFELAHAFYEQASAAELDREQRRWVDFRLADSAWRSASSTRNPDTTRIEEAAEVLAKLGTTEARDEERDRVWVEVQESLGDLQWSRDRGRDWGGAWVRFEGALAWWAASPDIELARDRYLGIVWKVAQPNWHRDHWGHRLAGGRESPTIFENAAKIAETPDDRSRAHYLLGAYYAGQGRDYRFVGRALRELEAVIEFGAKYEWYDDALHARAQYLASTGRADRDQDGGWHWTPDYVEAARDYRRLLNEFEKGETSYWSDARRQLATITEPVLGVDVDRFFLPDSRIQFRVNWRNVKRVDFALYPTDLTRDVDLDNHDPGDWLNAIQLERLEATRSWTWETGDDGTHEPGHELQTLEEPLPRGAWVLEAKGGGSVRRAMVLVSDAVVTVKAMNDRLLAWCTDLQSGAPIPDARVRVVQRFHDGDDWRWKEATGKTGADGTALIDIRTTINYSNYFLAFAEGDRQGFAVSYLPRAPRPAEGWRIYAVTDRSTYRPLDEVQWKFVARTHDGGGYQTPASQEIGWEIRDPQGSIVGQGTEKLNAFGAAWTSFATTGKMPLGEYHVSFFSDPEGKRDGIGQAPLFRLEEYKLPEFEVTVEVPEDPAHPGSPRLYVLGDRVELDIEAAYYFGGPVAEASVEIFVYQKPHHHRWSKDRAYPWFYPQENQGNWWGGPGQQVLHEKVKTDDEGRAHIVFETPPDSGSDLQYTIEARVTDSSRREIEGRGEVRVTRQEYSVHVETKHAIHRPGVPVEVEFTAVDSNDHPLQAAGRAKVTRRRWVEVWVDPFGTEVQGAALTILRAEHDCWPPLVGPSIRPWERKFRGYEEEVVATADLKTGAEDGKVFWEFTPERDGYFEIAWIGEDSRGTPVDGRAPLFVAGETTRELGYLPGGIEIIVDRDTLEVGEEAVIMLTTPASGRWALFTVEAEDLLHFEVVHLQGTAKLIRWPIEGRHVPNIYLSATAVWDGQAFSDREELTIPPVEQFLEVEVMHDAEAYLPGEEGDLTIRVTDHDGKPASVELTVAVVDAALSYIQGDYAGDPRQFFFGERRTLCVQDNGSFHQGSFVRLVENEDGDVWDERCAWTVGGSGQGNGPPEPSTGARRSQGYSGGEVHESDGFFLGRGEMNDAILPMTRAKSGPLGPAAPEPAGLAGGAPTVRVRSDFRETALWSPAVHTDEDGTATLTVKYPDSTTRWRTTVRAVDRDTRIGIGDSSARTRQPIIARLQAPRFFQTGDEVVVSGIVNNNSDEERTVRGTLEVEGLELAGSLVDGALGEKQPESIVVPAGGEARLDWLVRVVDPGRATLKLTAVGGAFGDAMEREFPVYSRGIEIFLARGGKFDGDELGITIDLPEARRPGTTSMVVQVTPSMAVTMLDALPYLVGYPYGCTEQTLSRFLPSAIVAGTLADFGLSAEEAMSRVFGGIETEHATRTHPDGKKSLGELDRMVEEGMARLHDFQHSDGGWSWWKSGKSDPFMTAYVLWGLSLARDRGIEVREGVLENAARWLSRELAEQENRPDLQAWMLHALAAHGAKRLDEKGVGFMNAAFANLAGKDRTRLSAYTRALLALAAHHTGRTEEAKRLVENLYNGVKIDETPDTSIVQVGDQASQPFVLQTAHWGSDGIWRRWSDGPVETTAFALRALLAIDPDHELVEPIVNWLVKNRRGAQWSNTRDTAIVVLALDEYLKVSGELAREVSFEVVVNGGVVASRTLTRDELLGAPSEFEIDRERLRDGANEVVIRRIAGDAPLYFAVHTRFFSLEEPIPARGNEIFVRREYYKLVGRPTLLAGYVYDRVPLRDGDRVTSGERIEVVLTVEAKNDLEYLIFEDLKPAGFEAVQVRSGAHMVARQLKSGEAARRFDPSLDEGEQEARKAGGHRGPREGRFRGEGYTGRAHGVHQELRDRKVALFVSELDEGFWELRYDLRAEVPGRFTAMPLLAHAMYVPEIRANGRDLRVEVLDIPAQD